MVGRITDFFQLKRPLQLEDIEEEMARELPTVSPKDSAHPFFVAQVKKRREFEDCRERDLVFSSIRKCPDDAPLFPLFSHTPQIERILGETIPCSNHKEFNDRWSIDKCIGPFIGTVMDPPSGSWAIDGSIDLPGAGKFLEPSSRYDLRNLESIQGKILEWIAEVPEEDADDACHWVDSSAQLERVTANRSIVFLSGPTGTGKSVLARTLANRLAVPLKEIDAAVTIRTGRAFEDVKSASHGQRDALRRFLQPVESVGNTASSKIKMVVLVDEVDLIFPCDRFYTALNSFLREVPGSILVILTANIGIRCLDRWIDLPPGSLLIESVGLLNDTAHHAALELNFDQVIHRSVLDQCHAVVNREQELADIPTSCVPFDSEYIPPGTDALWRDLQREGWMTHCVRHQDWVLEYRPAWKYLEEDAAERHETRLRRTARKIRHRSYLMGVPQALITRLWHNCK
ncbi:ATP-dependent Clp protease ATP-binding subunit ClpX [Paramicrosporidium saccamoebae]|uniref:ATP-dependent Clp protease ATP-binding subunit ClpX n=1 Tax=Paramicrosporidium saccamoebae TaxID=1246581 RepID=A0A2H9TQE6_9FUNG|nr:ATP-dependent Clp protease ATP-binding subunit ClpX [Paramicrosporidium saccamoebae]